MKHDGPKRGQRATRSEQSSRGQATPRGQTARADASLVGRRYETGAALRSAGLQSGGNGGGLDGGQVVSSMSTRAADLRSQHGGVIQAGSERAGVPESAVAAVVLTESDHVGATEGRPALRFEPYAFYQRTGHWVVATHKDQGAEYAAFERAAVVDADAAHASVRVGLGQVSGTEAEAAGFGSASEMMTAMNGDEAAQLEGLVALISNDTALCTALAAEDWGQVAELRAGPGYGAICYDEALASYAAAYEQSAGPAHGDDDDGAGSTDDGRDDPDDKKKRTRRRPAE